MDPNETLRRLLQAVATEDREAEAECANALFNWLYRGGFVPILEDSVAKSILMDWCQSREQSARLVLGMLTPPGRRRDHV